jgi:hypothetical protein
MGIWLTWDAWTEAFTEIRSAAIVAYAYLTEEIPAD